MISILTFFVFFLFGIVIIRKVNIELFTFLFVLLLPMRGLSPEQSGILGRLSPDNFATGFLLVSLILSRGRNSVSFKQLDSSKKLGFFLMLVFLLGVHYFIKIKDILIVGETAYGMPPEGIKLYQLLRDLVIVYTFFLLSKRLYNQRILRAVNLAVVYGSIILSVTIIFPGLVQSYGLIGGFSVSERQSGILNVNPNVAGSYCSIIIGYVLALFNNKEFHKGYDKGFPNRPVLIVTGVFLFVAILYTGSRQALVAVLLVTMYYLLTNIKTLHKNFNIFYFLLLLFIFYLFYRSQGQMMQTRITESIETGGGTLQSRVEHWSVYINDLANNPEYLISGNTKPLPLNYRYNSHNLYIFLLWNTGIFILGLLVYWLYKLYKNGYKRLENRLSFNIRFCLGAFVLTSFVNSFVMNYTFVAIILMSSGIPFRELSKGYKYNQKNLSKVNLQEL